MRETWRWWAEQRLGHGQCGQVQGSVYEIGAAPLSTSVWTLWAPWVESASLWLWLGDLGFSCGPLQAGSGGARAAEHRHTLHLRVLHEYEEGVAQRGAHCLCAAKEQVVCGHQQGVHAEVA